MGQSKIIKTENVVHEYDIWEQDEKKQKIALRGVSLDVAPGEFLAILGSNGSGKSTLAKHLNVLLLPDQGKVWVDGKDTADEANIWKIRDVVGMVFQNPDNQIVGTSVEEDTAFGPENRNLPSSVIQSKVAQSLQAVGLWDKRKSSPTRLSGGQKQRLAVAGVLATDSRCIVLDEPTAMLDPVSRRKLIETVEGLHREGHTIILITHHPEEAVNADRIILMENGEIADHGTPAEIFAQPEKLRRLRLSVPVVTELGDRLANAGIIRKEGILRREELVEAILSAVNQRKEKPSASDSTSESRPACERPSDAVDTEKTGGGILEDPSDNPIPAQGECLLEVDHLAYTYGRKTANELPVLKDVSMTIQAGEFLGLIGGSGAGKTTLIKHLNGLLKAEQGDIRYRGESIYAPKYHLRDLRMEVGVVFQYPEHQLFCDTVLKDVSFGPKQMKLSEEDSLARAKKSLALVGLSSEFYQMHPQDLSGGQKRKVAIAGVLAMEPRILVMDEPAAGLDQGSKEDLFQLIRKLQIEENLAIVLVSHDMEDIAEHADRVYVLHDGEIGLSGTPQAVFNHKEKLQEMEISSPEVTEIFENLQAAGLPLKKLPTRMAEAERMLLELWEKGGDYPA